jgi:hypothetical protein
MRNHAVARAHAIWAAYKDLRESAITASELDKRCYSMLAYCRDSLCTTSLSRLSTRGRWRSRGGAAQGPAFSFCRKLWNAATTLTSLSVFSDCLYPQGLPKLLAADGSDSALPPLDHLLLDKAGPPPLPTLQSYSTFCDVFDSARSFSAPLASQTACR